MALGPIDKIQMSKRQPKFSINHLIKYLLFYIILVVPLDNSILCIVHEIYVMLTPTSPSDIMRL